MERPDNGWPISNSEMQVASQCLRKWYLAYYLGLTLRQEKVVGALPLGSRLHTSIEGYFQSKLDGEPKDIEEVHSTLVEADRLTLLSLGYDTSDLDKEAELGRIMLSGFVEWLEEEGIDANLDIRAVEKRLEYPVFDGQARIVGKIDMLAHDRMTNANVSVDYKSSARFSDILETAHMNQQVMTYNSLDLAVDADQTTDKVESRFWLLKKVKRTARAVPPFYLEHVVHFNRKMLRHHWEHMLSKVNEILDLRERLDDGESHHSVTPPTVTRNCTYQCDFVKICPMFDDGSPVEEIVDELYISRNPYAYHEKDQILDAEF